MEILQFLLSFLLKDSNLSSLAPLLEKLKESNFDLKKVLLNLNPETIFPLISSFMQDKGQNKSPSTSGFEEEGLQNISNFADKQIVECLNCYFSRE
ncbi:MAG: hypothetical protein IKA12_02325 [Clostridia bacterium]|nr:hypothetical protein [Clostridia bacterium]